MANFGKEGPAVMADYLTNQRLADLEHINRGLSHEASNWLYSVMGQTELAERHLRQMAVALRYADRLLRQLERDKPELTARLPATTLAMLRNLLTPAMTRRRLEGLRRARLRAQHVADALHTVYAFAAGRETTEAMVDLNSAVRAAAQLLHLGYYRYRDPPPQALLDLREGLSPVSGSFGLISGIIIDLAAANAAMSLQLRTEARDGEGVCIITLWPVAAPAPCEAALEATRLCGGQLRAIRQDDRLTYYLSLPFALPSPTTRSESS